MEEYVCQYVWIHCRATQRDTYYALYLLRKNLQVCGLLVKCGIFVVYLDPGLILYCLLDYVVVYYLRISSIVEQPHDDLPEWRVLILRFFATAFWVQSHKRILQTKDPLPSITSRNDLEGKLTVCSKQPELAYHQYSSPLFSIAVQRF